MAGFAFPIIGRMLYSTGDLLLRAELNLLLKDNVGHWHQELFLVDPGTEMTTMPAVTAKNLGLPMPQQIVPGAVMTHAKLPFRSGLIRARILGTDSTEYAFPCYFLGDPSGQHSLNQPASRPRNLLGLSGVINQLRFTFDGEPDPNAPHGHIIIEKI